MAIEVLIQELIEAVKANTAALGGAAASTTNVTAAADTAAADTKTTTKTTGKTKTTAAPKGPKREEVVALLTKIKDDHGTADAKAVLAGVCGDEVKMAQIPDESLKAVFDAATAFLAKAEGADDSGDDDGL